jgi:DNA-binding MarR family transcriptional regulator
MNANLTPPLPALLDEAKQMAVDELHRRLHEEGHPQVRPGHGCVFRFIDADGSRLTDLAERARMTKQAVGEVVADLAELGYVERAPDPDDGRAKLIKLTERGGEARQTAVSIFAEIEREWAERFGSERIAAMRELLEDARASEDKPRSLPFRPPSTPRTPPA